MTSAGLTCPEPEVQDDWVLAAEARLRASVAEALSLRLTGGLPSLADGPAGVLADLSACRVRMDRVELILAEVDEFRTRLRVVWKESKARVEDGWARAVTGSAGSRRTSFGEYGGDAPRERYAKADVSVIGDRINERRRERVFDAVNDAHDVIERVRRSLDSFRMDLHAVLRVLAVPEHRLDRTEG